MKYSRHEKSKYQWLNYTYHPPGVTTTKAMHDLPN